MAWVEVRVRVRVGVRVRVPPLYAPLPISSAPGSMSSPWTMTMVSLPASPPRKT